MSVYSVKVGQRCKLPIPMSGSHAVCCKPGVGATYEMTRDFVLKCVDCPEEIPLQNTLIQYADVVE